MNLLLDDRMAPITSEMGFIECDVETTTQAYALWSSEILRAHGMRIELTKETGTLEALLLKLLPLTLPIRTRYLFVPTNSTWTAYFDNGSRGTDAASPVRVLAGKLRCKGVRAVYVPHTMPAFANRNSKGRYGATILEIYGPDGKTLRSIYAANDGGKWRFGENGIRLPFEDTEAYRSRRIRERFTGEMLDRYLKQLGLRAFDETFYATGDRQTSVIARQLGKLPEDLKEMSIELDTHNSIGAH